MTKTKTISFVGNVLHKKTGSTDFIIQFYKKYFEVDVFWAKYWYQCQGLDYLKLNEKDYDFILFLQMMPDPQKLMKLRCQNIILIPMLDAVLGQSDSFFRQYKNYKFINFSKALHNKIISAGLDSKYVQYYPIAELNEKPELNDKTESDERGEGIKVFFWQRNNAIKWKTVKKLISGLDVDSVHIHAALDPGFKFNSPSKGDVRKYNIKLSSWFDSKQEYLKTMSACDLFIASRIYEGIGLSFLEALARGKCVVAPNKPTMNEYIVHGFNGFLYREKKPNPIPADLPLDIVRDNARKIVEQGYKRWIKTESEILGYIQDKRNEKRKADQITLILCTCNRYELIKETLQSIFENTIQPNEIIIVDQSDDHERVKEIVNSIQQNREILLVRDIGKGLSRARNIGCNLATGDIYCFVDDDAFVHREWLENTKESFKLNGYKVGICGGKIIPLIEEVNTEWSIPKRWEHFLPSYQHDYEIGPYRNNELPPGVNYSIHSELFNQLGPFNEQLGVNSSRRIQIFGEDMEYCLRAKKAGYSIIYNPESIVYHPVSKKRQSQKYLNERLFCEGHTRVYVTLIRTKISIIIKILTIMHSVLYLMKLFFKRKKMDDRIYQGEKYMKLGELYSWIRYGFWTK